ncbi:MAG: hypothetical protein ACRCSK_07560, partial [Fusobacteriaceae bacterium]
KAMGYPVETLKESEKHLAFVYALKDLQKKCGVDNLKMSDYGIKRDEMKKMTTNARENMVGLFTYDPYKLSFEETLEIMEKAYK